MNTMQTYERRRLFGSLAGVAFAVLTLIAFLTNGGPARSDGVTVVEYYTSHGSTTLWGAAIFGVAVVGFILFAETFAAWTSAGPVGVVGAAVTAALYLVAVGCWEILGEIFGSADIVDVPSRGYDTAHVIQVVGTGAAHMGNFAAAAFVASTAAALLDSGSWRTLGVIGMGVAAFRLATALLELASSTKWSDAVTTVGFLAFLAWMFAVSVALAVATQRRARLVPQAT